MIEAVPTVPGDPLLGNLREFRSDRIGLLRRVPERFGDIARLRVGFFFQAFLVSSPDLVRQVLVDQDEAFEGRRASASGGTRSARADRRVTS